VGDFLVDFRPRDRRQTAKAAEFLKFHPDMHVETWDDPACGVVLSSADDPTLWGSFHAPDGTAWVGLCGRIALEQTEWEAAGRVNGEGGLACKFILKSYREGGVQRVAELGGNFVIILFDRNVRTMVVVTDRWGLMPAFTYEWGDQLALSSHPDALADAVGEGRNWDLTSFAEFILTCKLSYPFTYYQRIKALPYASVTTVALDGDRARVESTRPYFEFRFNPQTEGTLKELVDEFAAGFRKSAAKRTLPIVGRAAIGLSGGLDSRTLLCAVPQRDHVVGFCCYDEENEGFRTARRIAREAGAEFVPLRRGCDFYADSAVLGVKISAGMGCIASNHFLGFRKELKDLGVANLLTGCYCDYLFKGLAFNKRVNWWTTVESVGRFDFSYYAAHLTSSSDLGLAVQRRLEEQFPPDLRRYDTEARLAEVEHRRMFPLCYEEDNAARTIPQRTMGWFAPIAENDLMATRLKMTSAMKLNRRLFARAAEVVCDPAVFGVADANTGAPINSSLFREAVSSHLHRAESFVRKFKPSLATNGSWLNWDFYVNHSEKVRSLWHTPNRDADEVFRQVLGEDGFHNNIRAYGGRQLGVFLQLFTLKLWFDQRAS
jgi:asparagine synthase (glutamine-hydrolysing)